MSESLSRIFIIQIAEENVRALSSRTMISKELYAYHIKEKMLNEVRAFTGAKYSDSLL